MNQSAISRVFLGFLVLALAACAGGGGGGGGAVDAPSDLIASAVSPTQVQLRWTAPAGAVTGYVLERRQGDGSFAAVGGSLSASSVSFIDLLPVTVKKETEARSVSYRLKALNGSASSDPVESNRVSVPSVCASGSSDVPTRGCFGPVQTWPLVPTFSALLPDGRVIGWYASDAEGVYRERTDVHNIQPRSQSALGVEDRSRVAVWNPRDGSFASPNLDQINNKGTDLFCAGYTVLNDGKLLTAGGNTGNTWGSIRLNLFDPATSGWENGPGPKTPNLWRDRWYPTLTKLPSGGVLISGGTSRPDTAFSPSAPGTYTETRTGDSSREGQNLCRTSSGACPAGLEGNLSSTSASGRGIKGGFNNALEIYDSATGGLSMLSVTAQEIPSFEHYYPWFHVAPNGMVYLSGASQEKAFLSTSGGGQWLDRKAAPVNNAQRPYGSSVMYRPGEVLVTGGGYAFMEGSAVRQGQTATGNNTLRITLNGSSAAIAAGPNMNLRRTHHNSTLLANGQVFVSGGQQNGGEFGYSASLPWERTVNPDTIWNVDLAVRTSEIWTPGGSFQPAARAAEERMYHSVAMLLPDATVLTAGGGGCGTCDNLAPQLYGSSLSGQPSAVRMARINKKNSEVFYPPYLFKPDGSLQERPVILETSIAESGGFPTVGYNSVFTLGFAHPEAGRSIGKVALVALGAPTHAFDQNQRYLEPTITSRNGNTLTLSTAFTGPGFGNASASQNAAPPGFYMLFILDDQGVPSEAKIIRLQ